jgi:threonine dehydrogenase-like Zn-dependent dehydrogenase
MMEFIGPMIAITNVVTHRTRAARIERFIRHTPETTGHEIVGRCPVCELGEMRVRRDGDYYVALCANGCGQASTLR